MDVAAASQLTSLPPSSLWRLLPLKLLFIGAADAAVSVCVCVCVQECVCVCVSRWVGMGVHEITGEQRAVPSAMWKSTKTTSSETN